MQSVPDAAESGRNVPIAPSQSPRDTTANLGETSSTSTSQVQEPNEPIAGTSSAASVPEVSITLDETEGKARIQIIFALHQSEW